MSSENKPVENPTVWVDQDGVEIPWEEFVRLEAQAAVILTDAILGVNKKYSTEKDTKILLEAVKKKIQELKINPGQVIATTKEKGYSHYYIKEHFLKYSAYSDLSNIWAEKRKSELVNKLYECDECHLTFHPVNNHPEACHVHNLDGDVDRIYKGHGREFGISIWELQCCGKKFLAYSPDCPEPAVEEAMGICPNGNGQHYSRRYEDGLPPESTDADSGDESDDPSTYKGVNERKALKGYYKYYKN